MLRVRNIAALGQVPYQDQIASIARNFPPCFTSGSIVPKLDQIISEGQTLNQQAINNAPTVWFGGFNPGDIGNAVKQLQDLRNRYASENPGTQYCNYDSATKDQHYKTIQAITGIYQAAAGVAGGMATISAANAQFWHDINPLNALPPILPGLGLSGWQQWATLIGLGLAVYLVSQRNKPPVLVSTNA